MTSGIVDEFRTTMSTLGKYMKKCSELRAFQELGMLGWLCLSFIGLEGRILPIELCSHIGASSRRVRKMLDDLQANSLVEYSADGRVTLTASGEARLTEMSEALAKEIKVTFHPDRARNVNLQIGSLYGRFFKSEQDPNFAGRRARKRGDPLGPPN